jgi:hypothetical protein
MVAVVFEGAALGVSEHSSVVHVITRKSRPFSLEDNFSKLIGFYSSEEDLKRRGLFVMLASVKHLLKNNANKIMRENELIRTRVFNAVNLKNHL